MDQWIAIVLVLGLFAIGDIASSLTGARVSSVFVTLMLFLGLFMSGIFPADIMSISGLQAAAGIAGQGLVFHMGTNINIRQLLREWRTLLLAIVSMVVALVSVFAVAPIVGWDSAVVAIPIVNGCIVATNIMVDAALAKGATMAAALGTLAYGVQKFVGTIPASKMGLAEANLVVEELRRKKAADPDYSWYAERDASLHKGGEAKIPFWKKHEKMWTTYVCLFVVYVANEIGVLLAGATNSFIPASIWCLILGCVCAELGIVPPKILDKGGSSGFFMVLVYVSIIASLATVTFADLLNLSMDLILIFGAVLVGTFLFLYLLPGWKIVGSKNLAVGIAMAQLLGYPATYLITQEIARTVGKTEEERDAITARIEPAYVLAGFATVTSFSVIIAGFFVNLL